jgi:hypothetical protein
MGISLVPQTFSTLLRFLYIWHYFTERNVSYQFVCHYFYLLIIINFHDHRFSHPARVSDLSSDSFCGTLTSGLFRFTLTHFVSFWLFSLLDTSLLSIKVSTTMLSQSHTCCRPCYVEISWHCLLCNSINMPWVVCVHLRICVCRHSRYANYPSVTRQVFSSFCVVANDI